MPGTLHCSALGPRPVLGCPSAVGAGVLPAQLSGPPMLLPSSSGAALSAPAVLVRLSGPETAAPSTSTPPLFPLRVSGPESVSPAQETPGSSAPLPIRTKPVLPLTAAGPATVLPHSASATVPLADRGPLR